MWTSTLKRLPTIGVAVVLSGCSTQKTPASPSASIVSIAVNGPAPAVGAATQFTAIATMSDSSTQTVTSQATWASSNTAVATVNSAGVVTGVAAGETDITATFQNIAGRSHLALSRTAFTLSGSVTDGTSGGVLPGVTVQAVDASGNTQTIKTDNAGAYAFNGVAPGTAAVSATAVSYQTFSQTMNVSANARLDIVLQRVACTFTLSTSGLAFGVSGGTGTVTITSQATGCAWTARSNDAFLTITSASSGLDNGSVTFSVAANSGPARSGTLIVAGLTLTVIQDAASIVTATYDGTFKTPACSTIGSACDSGLLLVGSGSSESNQPNTVFNSCSDGSGSGHLAALGAIRVSTLDGSPLAPGKEVRIDIGASLGSTIDLHVYVAGEASAPSWNQVFAQRTTSNGVFSWFAQTFLPASSSGFEAIRVNSASGGGFGPGPCTTGTDDDTDDLVFRVR